MELKDAARETFDEIVSCFKLSLVLKIIIGVSWIILTIFTFASGAVSIIMTIVWIFVPTEYLHQDIGFRLSILWVTFTISGVISRISYKMMKG